MDSKCSDLIGLVHLMATRNNTLAPENLRKKGNLMFAVTVCTSVRLQPTASIIIILTAITRLQKSLLMVKCRRKVTSHALINWKSCVKSRGMKCCESSILEKIARVVAIPGTETPGIETAGTGTLETTTLETATPGTATPEITTLGTGTPGTTTPGTGTLETTTLETATPGTATPEITTPGTATLETATPGTETQGTETPGTGTNRLIILAVLIQKNRRSCYLISRQV